MRALDWLRKVLASLRRKPKPEPSKHARLKAHARIRADANIARRRQRRIH